jgi:6-phosphogluconolactonase (cycloisomerase 2 family)
MLSLRSSLLLLFVGGGLTSVACGDDDGGSDPAPSGGKGGGGGIAGSGGAKTGGAGGLAGGAKTGGAGGGTTTGGAPPTGGNNPGGGNGGTTGGSVTTGGTTESGAGGAAAGEAGQGGQAGGGAAGEGGTGGDSGGGGEGGTDEEVGGSGGEAGQAALSPKHLYVGCADGSGSLQAYLFNGTALSPISTTLTTGAISNATFNNDQDVLYVAHKASNGDTTITTYTRNTTSGALTPLGTPADVPIVPPSEGGAGGEGGAPAGVTEPGPQTLTLDNNEDFLAVPNYDANNVYVYEVLGNGSVGEIVSDDSDGENAHHAIFSNNNNFMLVPYLGSDKITVYAFDDATGDISVDSDETMPEGDSGPRHIALHPNGTWLYAIHETAGGASSATGLLDFFLFNQGNGDITHQDAYEVPLPDGYTGLKNGSEIALSPSGEFVFVSMRLDNSAEGSIVVFKVNTGGTLSFVQQVRSRGVTPRQFSLSSDGRLLVVGNQNSDTVALFSVDSSSGELTFIDDRDVCDSPRFARFADIAD